MADALIDNPILNSPFLEPERHFKFTDEYQYHPDLIAVLDDSHGVLDPLNLIIEVTGEKKKEKAAKVMTARTLWVPAVNNH